jgi:Ubiquitin-protein ligase
VNLYVDWLLNKSIENQFKPFYKGFRKVVNGDMIKVR